MTDPLEQVIRPIVEGQIRSFTYDHPEVVEAVKWYKPRPDKRVTFVNSLAKRIVRDLLCPTTRERLAAVLVGVRSCENRQEGEADTANGLTEADLAFGSVGSHVDGPVILDGSAGDGMALAAVPSPTQGGINA